MPERFPSVGQLAVRASRLPAPVKPTGRMAVCIPPSPRNPPVRIAYITETYPPELNGVALTVERTVAHLRASGHEVQVIRPRQAGEPPRDDRSEWRTAGCPIPMYPDLRFGWASGAEFERRWSGRARDAGGGLQTPPDLVHVATPGPLGWTALRTARALGLPTSADFRTNFHAYSRHYGLAWLEPVVLGWLRRLHDLADTTFVPTRRLARELGEQGFQRLQVVGRGVDAQRFCPRHRDEALRRSWQATGEGRVMLYVGRLAAEKNAGLALDCFESLRGSYPGLRMVVVGDGPERAALQARHPLVHFAGPLTGAELARHYASADVFLFPSLTDTFGNVTLEALASGLAVAAFDTACAGQLIQDGMNGWLAPARDGEDGRQAFRLAAERALLTASPDGVLRQWARMTGVRTQWDDVLRRFESSLVNLARAPRGVAAHAALA